MDYLSPELISKSIGFHGQPLQKIWEGERGENDLLQIGVVNPDFSAYQSRQKYFSFQDRAKRLKLHQFIAKKANTLYSARLVEEVPRSNFNEWVGPDICATIPPYDTFFHEKIDKSLRLKHLYGFMQPGDIIFGTIVTKVSAGMIVRLLCTATPTVRNLADLNAKAFLPNSEAVPAIERKGTTRNYISNDSICCEIIELMAETEKIVVGMKGLMRQPGVQEYKIPFGLVTSDCFPEIYKVTIDAHGVLYEQLLEESSGFRNTNCIDYLTKKVGLDSNVFYTNMSGLRGRFPQQEMANDLRNAQASKWAFRSVAEGIEHFKEGRHTEAFQCLNKALNIDPRNVEGLVARGALYANSGAFKKAVDDFEKALELNANHANARKYKGETLVALGRSYEEDNKFEEAKKAYQECLIILPQHEEAINSLEFLWSKTNAAANSKQLIEPNELTLPALNLKMLESNRQLQSSGDLDLGGNKKDGNLDTSTSITTTSSSRKDKKSKKKKSKSRKRRSSSTTSSDSSSDSSDSSSTSTSSSESSSSSDSDQSTSKSKKKRRRADKMRQKSLSPLSKRMALMSNTDQSLSHTDTGNAYNHSYGTLQGGTGSGGMGGLGVTDDPTNDEYELRVRKFLEMTRDEENYEEKVRKFVEEAAKYRKDRKAPDEKSKKKDKKKSRKLKKDGKKKRKEKKGKTSKKDKDDLGDLDNVEFREALKIFKNLPVFDFNSKLTQDLSAAEKTLIQLKDEREKKSKDKNEPMKEEENKWKMMFAKDDRKKDVASTSKNVPKQYEFTSNDDDNDINYGAPGRGAAHHHHHQQQQHQHQHQQQLQQQQQQQQQHQQQQQPQQQQVMMGGGGGGGGMFDKKNKRPPTPPSPYLKYGNNSDSLQQPTNKAQSGPIVLDKFGNFRLADQSGQTQMGTGGTGQSMLTAVKPPEPPPPPRRINNSRSRTRSPRRRYSSDSRSRSRSLQKRRSSRSRSYVKRHNSRSRSRSYRTRSGSRSSYSRSRSRSGSLDRRRGDRRFRGRGNYDRGTYYKPRFNNFRGRGRGGFRDYRDFRGGRGRDRYGRKWVNRGAPYRRYSRERRFDRRSRSRSYDSEEPRRRSPTDDRKHSDNESNGGVGVGNGGRNTRRDRNDRKLSPLQQSSNIKDNNSGSAGAGGGAASRDNWDADTDEHKKQRNDNRSNNNNNNQLDDASLEDIEKIIDKAKKENKEDMIERNKDIVKKTTTW